MTDEEIIKQVRDLRERIDDLEDERDAIKKLPTAVAELHGAVAVLRDLVMARFDGVQEGVDRASSLRTALTFAAVVVVPVIVALVGGYFALRTGLAQHATPSK